MQYQFITYVHSRKITVWKSLILINSQFEFIYGSGDSNIFANIPDNSILWIIESITGRPPNLVARLHVKKVQAYEDIDKPKDSIIYHFKEYKWIAIGTDQSQFYGFNNFEKPLMNMNLVNRRGTWQLSRGQNWNPSLGVKLRAPRKFLFDSTMEEILRPYMQNGLPNLFISWKWRDNDKSKMIKFAYALTELGFVVWLDVLLLKKSRALDYVEKDYKKLEKLLSYGYLKSDYLLAINSSSYGIKTAQSQKNWTLQEWEGNLGMNKNIKRILVQQGDSSINKTFTEKADFTIEKSPIHTLHQKVLGIIQHSKMK